MKKKETNQEIIQRVLARKVKTMVSDVKEVYDLPYQGLPTSSEVGELLMRMAKRIDDLELKLDKKGRK